MTTEELAIVRKAITDLDERMTALETIVRHEITLRLGAVEGHVNRLDEDTALTQDAVTGLEKFTRGMDEAVARSLDVLEEAIGEPLVSAAGRRLKAREAAQR